MANLKFNTNNIRRVPINRNSLFYDADMFALEREIGKDYIEQDMGQTVVLYQVDASQTQTDAVYGETDTDNVAFKTPVEIPCTYKIEQPELKSYDKSKQLGTYMKTGKLTIGVYQETLVELNVEIKKGDRICQFRIMEKQPNLKFVEGKMTAKDRGGFGSTGTK